MICDKGYIFGKFKSVSYEYYSIFKETIYVTVKL
jgi:hypothetical protein